ncbi:MAG: cyclic nucleotide-binding domain-containing protein [Candidatus Delongbacteria bacterium]|nr:cyclic nucleotide-binding domain-containing protein [Candidatus Delongbacteria bacterium]
MIEHLKKARMFEGLDESVIKKISAFSKIEKFKPNITILEEDSSNDYDLFIVIHGRVKIFVSSKFFADDKDDSKAIYTVNPYDHFGEMSCIVRKRRSASATTMSDCEIIRIDGHKFMTLIENDNSIGFMVLKKLYESLYERIQNSNFMLRNFLI